MNCRLVVQNHLFIDARSAGSKSRTISLSLWTSPPLQSSPKQKEKQPMAIAIAPQLEAAQTPQPTFDLWVIRLWTPHDQPRVGVAKSAKGAR
jgi:hypothetical protein